MQTSGTNSEHKHSEIKHFSTLNCNKCKIIKTQKTLSLSIASKFSDMHLCFVFCAVFVLSLLLVIMGGQHDGLLLPILYIYIYIIFYSWQINSAAAALISHCNQLSVTHQVEASPEGGTGSASGDHQPKHDCT